MTRKRMERRREYGSLAHAELLTRSTNLRADIELVKAHHTVGPRRRSLAPPRATFGGRGRPTETRRTNMAIDEHFQMRRGYLYVQVTGVFVYLDEFIKTYLKVLQRSSTFTSVFPVWRR